MNILVFGASGQLGQCLKITAAEKQVADIAFPSEGEANILDIHALEVLFEQHQPRFAVNCAAYTAVDKAEDDVETCRKINNDGAENLAILCKKYGTTLIHVSTDFVFEGNTVALLNESDLTAPVNVYGLTKLEGEQAIAGVLDEHFVVRTSWLYSEYGNNFVKTMLRLGAERDMLRVIADQVGTPTYAIDLANCILAIIASGSENYGTYHYSNEGLTSWYDFAVAIFEFGGLPVNVVPVPTSEYVTRAVRPKFSVMDKTKTKATFNLTIPYWRTSLRKCVENLKSL